jgi:hypothetical protein
MFLYHKNVRRNLGFSLAFKHPSHEVRHVKLQNLKCLAQISFLYKDGKMLLSKNQPILGSTTSLPREQNSNPFATSLA